MDDLWLHNPADLRFVLCWYIDVKLLTTMTVGTETVDVSSIRV